MYSIPLDPHFFEEITRLFGLGKLQFYTPVMLSAPENRTTLSGR